MEKTAVKQENYEDEIDLLELWYVLKRKAVLIFAIAILGAGLFGGYTKLLIQPTYTAQSTLYVFDQSTNLSTYNDLQMGTQLANDFTVLATSRPVVEKMIEALNLHTDYETVVKSISAENESGTRLINISVDNRDPQLAAQIANGMAEALVERVMEIMETSRAYVAVPATAPTKPSAPHLIRNVAIGAFLGAMIVAGSLTVRFIRDDTLKTAEDIEKFLDTATLAEIPLSYSKKELHKKNKAKTKPVKMKRNLW